VITGPTMSTDHRGRGQLLAPEFEQELPIEFATGAAIGLRMDAVRAIGGWDTRFAPAYYEDVDIAARMRKAGWEVRLIPSMRALHHEGATLGHSPDYYVYLHRNRIRYALEYLSSEEWHARFLPAEFARLRALLAGLDGQSPSQIVGAESIDMLLRGLDPLAAPGAALSVPLAPAVPALGLEDLRTARGVRGRPLTSRIPLLGAMRNLVNDLGPRWYIDRALAEQREFNDAVVRALEAQQDHNRAQDRVNRERLAGTLLLALILLERLHRQAESS
jgi:hypothetical protein